MSQILVPRIDKSQVLLFQDLYYEKKKTTVQSTVKEAVCTICEKGLEDGVSVTAKKIVQKMRLFCQYHMPKDI
ncbi:MAG: hypothetical protein AUF73_00865 [Thaumarchaeota archaeon 13_1_20CM_2_39_11]|nr:MAG: hypothetical protein AUI59_02030 [Thaumarchaeota archaeon 13_1_40CM_2_39_13_1]OLE44778.1 MAG: hypothetical protein AUF73_00865 [Thaumarchaeota archaeon 13_1_20CM_2_39_11]